MATTCDFLVIGGGIAGASAAYELAPVGRVIVLEREPWPGYHATGRSAAHFTETYGNAVIRRLVRAGRAFLEAPPEGFGDHPLLVPRGLILVAGPGQEGALADAAAEAQKFTPSVRTISPQEAIALVPVLRRDYVSAAIREPDSRDIEVHGLHLGYLKGLKARGGMLATDAEAVSIARTGGAWIVATRAGEFSAPVVINAAGAWADAVAGLAGVAPLGLTPKRRTVLVIDPPPGLDIASWPLVVDVAETFYFKPDAGRILASPADATPSPPCDAQPEELDIATGAARLEAATTLKVERIAHKWAGLRTFAADGTPVVGMDGEVEGFFWLCGQGGYGIKTAPALSRATASLISHDALPEDLVELGLTAAELSPERLRGAAPTPAG
ncbi:MAG: NAD(P)/FAD-dependent oxidoreductase [Kiloniellaceae bacterium]